MPVDVAGVGIFDLDARTCAPALDSLKGESRLGGCGRVQGDTAGLGLGLG